MHDINMILNKDEPSCITAEAIIRVTNLRKRIYDFRVTRDRR